LMRATNSSPVSFGFASPTGVLLQPADSSAAQIAAPSSQFVFMRRFPYFTPTISFFTGFDSSSSTMPAAQMNQTKFMN